MAPPVVSQSQVDPTRPDLMKGVFFRPEQMEPAGVRYRIQEVLQSLHPVILGNDVCGGLNADFIPGHGGLIIQISPGGYFVSLPRALEMIPHSCTGSVDINGKSARYVSGIHKGTKIQANNGKKVPLSDHSILLAPEYVYNSYGEEEGIVLGWLQQLEGNSYIPLAERPPEIGELVYVFSLPFNPQPPNREPLVSVGNVTGINGGTFEVDAEIRAGSQRAAIVRVKDAEDECHEDKGVELIGLVTGSWQKDFDTTKHVPFSRWERRTYTGLFAVSLVEQKERIQAALLP